MKVKTVQTKSV